ncbi:hypothetical protein HO173_000881 [Letharia columbiana]|uniref:Mtf2-like C-terminal domain-containing protein n=1 Tax=Letharia columbiana TaxID=112416 RepID=A0A8H6G639_9LECA|nr:uncharacterized protein HO173_000881 [Letharia columbiana]KAF6241087.1 hypothetical protein HO173_000881 [Letharia columbiana]
MSLSSHLISSFPVHIRVQSSSLLPFLYQTRTLLSEPKSARPFHAVHNNDRRRRTFCFTSRGQAYADKIRRPNTDPIVFVDPHHSQIPDTLSHTEPQKPDQFSRPSTVTATEQAVFNKLMKDASQPATPEPDEEDILDQDELTRGYDPNVDLNSIFENAIRQLRMQEEQAANSAAKSLLLAGMPRQRAIDILVRDQDQALSGRDWKRLKLANGTTLGNEVETEEERAKLEVACDDHRTLVMGMLDSANSDVEIWQVLEKEVFSLITHLDEHTKFVEKAKKVKALHAAKVRKAEAEGKAITDVKLTKRDLTETETSGTKLTQTKAIPIDNLLSILHRNYAEYCLNALRLMRRKHPTSFYAPHVLSTIKRRGPISTVLGVSTDIYNEILYHKWMQYSDLHGMADMIEEMLNQGIESNGVTTALIKGIAKQRRMGQRGFFGPVVKEWWAMRATVEGWRRVRNLFARILSEMAEREAVMVDEAESEE